MWGAIIRFYKKISGINSHRLLLRELRTMSNGQEAKRPCLDTNPHRKCIGTHNGTFHCDEVLACFMLKTLEEYKNARYHRIISVD